MAAPFYGFSDGLVVAGIWGGMAIAYLVLALRISDRMLAQSALLIGCAATVTVPNGWGPWFAIALVNLAIVNRYRQTNFERFDAVIAWLVGLIFCWELSTANLRSQTP